METQIPHASGTVRVFPSALALPQLQRRRAHSLTSLDTLDTVSESSCFGTESTAPTSTFASEHVSQRSGQSTDKMFSPEMDDAAAFEKVGAWDNSSGGLTIELPGSFNEDDGIELHSQPNSPPAIMLSIPDTVAPISLVNVPTHVDAATGKESIFKFRRKLTRLRAPLLWSLSLLVVSLTTLKGMLRFCACDARELLQQALDTTAMLSILTFDVIVAIDLLSWTIVLLAVIGTITFQFCGMRTVLPLMIEGHFFEAQVDDAGDSIMSRSVANRLGLKVDTTKAVSLVTVVGGSFRSDGEVTTQITLAAAAWESLEAKFHVCDFPSDVLVVGRPFLKPNNLNDNPRDPRFLYRPCTPGELYSLFADVMTGHHINNERDFIRLSIRLANGTSKVVEALLDSGSAFDVMSLETATASFPKGSLRRCHKYVKCVDGDKIRVKLEMRVELIFDEVVITRNLLIVPGLVNEMILGAPFNRQYMPKKDMADFVFARILAVPDAGLSVITQFGMQKSLTGTNWLLNRWHKIKKRSPPPASEAIRKELEQARHTEMEQEDIEWTRIYKLPASEVVTAREIEAARHGTALTAMEQIMVRLQQAKTQEQSRDTTAGSVVGAALPTAETSIPTAGAPAQPSVQPVQPSTNMAGPVPQIPQRQAAPQTTQPAVDAVTSVIIGALPPIAQPQQLPPPAGLDPLAPTAPPAAVAHVMAPVPLQGHTLENIIHTAVQDPSPTLTASSQEPDGLDVKPPSQGPLHNAHLATNANGLLLTPDTHLTPQTGSSNRSPTPSHITTHSDSVSSHENRQADHSVLQNGSTVPTTSGLSDPPQSDQVNGKTQADTSTAQPKAEKPSFSTREFLHQTFGRKRRETL